jgi:hypothetical protein
MTDPRVIQAIIDVVERETPDREHAHAEHSS